MDRFVAWEGTMVPVFLNGGGGEQTDRRFLRASTTPSGCRIAVVTAAATADEGQAMLADARAYFTALGAAPAAVAGIALTPGTALAADRLAALRPTGLFVWGGL